MILFYFHSSNRDTRSYGIEPSMKNNFVDAKTDSTLETPTSYWRAPHGFLFCFVFDVCVWCEVFSFII